MPKNGWPPAAERRVAPIEPTTLSVDGTIPRLDDVRGETFGKSKKPHRSGVFLGAERRNRTADTAIFSRLLYRLSYLGKPIKGGPGFPGPVAGATGFEPAISCVTGRRPEPLGHAPTYLSFMNQRCHASLAFWAEEDSNLQPLACDASALPLSYPPVRWGHYSK